METIQAYATDMAPGLTFHDYLRRRREVLLCEVAHIEAMLSVRPTTANIRAWWRRAGKPDTDRK